MRKPTGPRKVYGEVAGYERKLERVMERLGATDVRWDYTRQEAWVSFTYKGQFYRFDHNTTKASASGQRLYYGTDCFAQIVLSLEDIARMVERGIYDLQKWIEGMKALPPGLEIPDFLIQLGFTDRFPDSEAEIESAVAFGSGGDIEAFICAQCLDELTGRDQTTNEEASFHVESSQAVINFAVILAKRGIREVRILGVDFDNTITSGNTYPEIAPFRPHAIATLKEFQAAGGKVILITCREGKYLDDALIALLQAGFVPDAANDNLADFAVKQGLRKVYVDLSIDDKNLGCPLDWKFIGQVLRKVSPKKASETGCLE